MNAQSVGEKLLAKMDEWPESWIGMDEDRPLAREVARSLRPFLESLASESWAETTLRRHFGNAWLLGGEIVRDASWDPSVRRLEGRELLLHFVDEEGGPLLHGYATEAEQREFDGTCRRLYKYLMAEPEDSTPGKG